MCKFATEFVTIIQTVWTYIKIISVPGDESYPKTAVGCTASYIVKNYIRPRWLCELVN